MDSSYALLVLFLALSACRPRSPTPYAGFVDRAYQLLARVDAREREAVVAQAQANLEQARKALDETEANFGATVAAVNGAGADIAKARAALDEAQANCDRTRRLVRSGAEPDSGLTSATALLQEAKAGVESWMGTRAATAGRLAAVQAAVADAQAAGGTAEAALEVARVQLSEAQVLAPSTGSGGAKPGARRVDLPAPPS